MVKSSFLYDTQKELLVYVKCHPLKTQHRINGQIRCLAENNYD